MRGMFGDGKCEWKICVIIINNVWSVCGQKGPLYISTIPCKRITLTFFAVAIDRMIPSKHRATKWRHRHCCLSIFSLFTTLSFQWWYQRNTRSRIFFFRKCFKDVNVDIDGNNNIAIAILLLQYVEKVWHRTWIWYSHINGLFMDYHKLCVLVVLLLQYIVSYVMCIVWYEIVFIFSRWKNKAKRKIRASRNEKLKTGIEKNKWYGEQSKHTSTKKKWTRWRKEEEERRIARIGKKTSRMKSTRSHHNN